MLQITKSRVIAVSVTATALVFAGITTGGSAAATGKPSRGPTLSLSACCGNNGAFAGWTQAQGDGSTDTVTDDYSLQLTSGSNISHQHSYASATLKNAPMLGEALSTVSALSVDITGFSGGGAPRFSISTSDGNVVYAAPYQCGFTNGGGWTHVDFFTTALGACSIYTLKSNQSGNVSGYTSDGAHSAWALMLADPVNNGAATVSNATYVQDEAGTSYTDSLNFDGTVFTQP